MRKVQRPSKRVVPRNPRSLGLESLEDRTLPSSSNVFATFAANVAKPGASQQIAVSLSAANFTMPGKVAVLGFQVVATSGSPLDPAAVTITNAAGKRVAPRLIEADLAGRTQSLVLAALPAGNYVVTVAGDHHTTGAFRLDVFLAGDVNGDHQVTRADGAFIAGTLGATAGHGRYLVAADSDLDGKITLFDAAQSHDNLGVSTKIIPLTLSLSTPLGAVALPAGLATANATIALKGTTEPRAAVRANLGPNHLPVSTSADGVGNFSLSIPLAFGSNTLLVTSSDAFGQLRTATFTIVRDSVPPAIIARSAASLTNSTFKLTGQVKDGLTGVASFQAAVDKGAFKIVKLDGSGNFTLVTALATDGSADGSHLVFLRATDRVGNVGAAKLSFTLDTRPPTVTLTTPLAVLPVNTNLTLAGRVGDGLSGVAKLQVRVDSGAAAPLAFDAATGKFAFATAFALTGTADGPHTISFQATDRAGNVSPVAYFGFLLTTRPPTLVLTGPADGSTLAAGATLTGSATASRAPVVSVAYAFDNAVATALVVKPDGSFSQALNFSSLAPGKHALTVKATDQAGNSASRTVNVTVPVRGLTSAALQARIDAQKSSSPTNPVTIQAASAGEIQDALTAVNGLAPATTPVTVLNLPAGTFGDLLAGPPSGVTLVINGDAAGTTIVGHSPALAVSSGQVQVNNVTLTTATDSPTVLVGGGRLVLRNDTVRGGTTGNNAPIEITGGTLDLGTAASPGGNTISMTNAGLPVANTTVNSVSVGGDTFAFRQVAGGKFLRETRFVTSGTAVLHGVPPVTALPAVPPVPSGASLFGTLFDATNAAIVNEDKGSTFLGITLSASHFATSPALETNIGDTFAFAGGLASALGDGSNANPGRGITEGAGGERAAALYYAAQVPTTSLVIGGGVGGAAGFVVTSVPVVGPTVISAGVVSAAITSLEQDRDTNAIAKVIVADESGYTSTTTIDSKAGTLADSTTTDALGHSLQTTYGFTGGNLTSATTTGTSNVTTATQYVYQNGALDSSTTTDPRGVVRTDAYHYNADGGLARFSTQSKGYTATVDLLYDASGGLTGGTRTDATGTLAVKFGPGGRLTASTLVDPSVGTVPTAYAYNDDGSIKSATSTLPGGTPSTTAYHYVGDALADLTITDGTGITTTHFVYDTQNRLTTTTTSGPVVGTETDTITPGGDIAQSVVTDPDGKVTTTTNTLDALGNLTSKEVRPDGTTTTTYDAYGDVTKIVALDSTGTTTTTVDAYDALGNLVTATTTGPNGTTTSTYDGTGKLTRTVGDDSHGTITTTTFDGVGHPLTSKKTGPGGTQETDYNPDTTIAKTVTTDAGGFTTTFAATSDGHGHYLTTHSSDPAGNTADATYYPNATGQPYGIVETQIETTAAGTETDTNNPDGSPAKVVYTDTDGNVLSSRTYDGTGHLMSETQNASSGSATYHFDLAGGVTTVAFADAGGIATTTASLAYTPGGLLNAVTSTNGLGTRTVTLFYTFDGKGDPVTVTANDGSPSPQPIVLGSSQDDFIVGVAFTTGSGPAAKIVITQYFTIRGHLGANTG